MNPAPCEHLDGIENKVKPAGGCLECEAAGDTWVHLRFCVTCGQIGCCNDSKNRHAARHAATSGHPVMMSKEPREDWAWCFVDQVELDLPPLGD
jgi:hypothetical protein